jgi:hypothetical protein
MDALRVIIYNCNIQVLIMAVRSMIYEVLYAACERHKQKLFSIHAAAFTSVNIPPDNDSMYAKLPRIIHKRISVGRKTLESNCCMRAP